MAIISDERGNILWETKESPVRSLYKSFFNDELSGNISLILYAYQVGIAIGLLVDKIPVKACHAVKISEKALKLLSEKDIEVTYEEVIPLVKSSKDEHKVCPVEKFLYDHDDKVEQYNYLVKEYKD